MNLGITHVLNAAHGARHIDTGPQFYSDAGIEYHGVEASDCKDFDLRPFFSDAAQFIHVALRQQGSKKKEKKKPYKVKFFKVLNVQARLEGCFWP